MGAHEIASRNRLENPRLLTLASPENSKKIKFAKNKNLDYNNAIGRSKNTSHLSMGIDTLNDNHFR